MRKKSTTTKQTTNRISTGRVYWPPLPIQNLQNTQLLMFLQMNNKMNVSKIKYYFHILILCITLRSTSFTLYLC